MRFSEYKSLDLVAISRSILDFWERNEIFQKSIALREGRSAFVFYEGPPSANGMPGIHHVMARTIKDVFCRYKTQKGFQVKRKAGWDTHGLPVELGVEKELGINKEDIGKSISVADYNKACRDAVMRYTSVWNELTKRIGYWVDMENPYVTYASKYIETVWWLLKKIYDKDLLYKGHSIQPYSPMAGTGLSSHELNQPGTYKDVTDTTVTAQFKTVETSLPEKLRGDIPLYILAWTTTPWTLPSNTALTIGAAIDYVIISTFNQYTFKPVRVVLAKTLVEKQFGKKFFSVETAKLLSDFTEGDRKIPYFIASEVKGKDLIDIRYEQIWEEAPLPLAFPENAFRVISGDFVTTEEGTGIVHTAPTFGADDAKAAKAANPEVPSLLVIDENGNEVPLVNLKGRFRKEVGELGGKFVKNEYYPEGKSLKKSVDVEIAIKLKEKNLAFKVEKYVHSYPNCWRTDKPVLYYPLDSWFIKVTALRERMVELNDQINWKPKSTGEGRFGNWLANANDWNLSRSRFWGIPLPIWRTEDGKETKVVGSVAELISEIDRSVKKGMMISNPFKGFEPGNFSDSNYNNIDLHKNIVDDIVLCSESGQPMWRESDLIDVWFDSGAMPYAQWHYPFENKEKIDDGEFFPADYIAEGVDQTRGWFYTLHAIATLAFDSAAYKNVVSNGLVLDKNGQKMSKRLGNAIDPFATLDAYGPDATRWYMISNANPWDNSKFDLEGIGEVQRKFFGTLYNTYAFFSMYANADGFEYGGMRTPVLERPELDRWILSELNSLIQLVDAAYDDYEPTKAARAISSFVQEKMSNWYVRLSRRRFWKGNSQKDRTAAIETLYQCLVAVAKLSAPMAPFYMDFLYRDLTKGTLKSSVESVHLDDFPIADERVVDRVLENRINIARTLTSLALSLRKKKRIKVRQPLQRLIIPTKNESERDTILSVQDQLRSEVNVKTIELLDYANDILVKEVKPNYKVLGPKYGNLIGQIVQAVRKLTPQQIEEIEREGKTFIQLNKKKITLDHSDVEVYFKNIEGWEIAQGGGMTVALDVALTDELIQEGIARELVNRIQNFRKDLGLKVTDRIEIKIKTDQRLQRAVEKNKRYILSDTLCEKIHFVNQLEEGVVVEFDQVKTRINILKN